MAVWPYSCVAAPPSSLLDWLKVDNVVSVGIGAGLIAADGLHGF
jgi:hypothetical protein